MNGPTSNNCGGIDNLGTLIANDSTPSGNSAAPGGAIYNFAGSKIALQNSIVASNSVTGTDPDISGPVSIVNGVNCVGNTNGATGIGTLNVNNLAGNPMLAPLGNYGGPTQTMPPLAGSPVINAGVFIAHTLATDQRSLTRVDNVAVDIGTCEGQVSVAREPPLLTSLTKLGDGSCPFAFSNTPDTAFTALATTNVALPLSNWTVLGPVTEISPGSFQFSDPQATNYPQRFYRVRSP